MHKLRNKKSRVHRYRHERREVKDDKIFIRGWEGCLRIRLAGCRSPHRTTRSRSRDSFVLFSLVAVILLDIVGRSFWVTLVVSIAVVVIITALLAIVTRVLSAHLSDQL